MPIINEKRVNDIQDVIYSPKGGCLIIYRSGQKNYIPSAEYIIKTNELNKAQVSNYINIFKKRQRDNMILFKYILPNIFRSINLKMPCSSHLMLKTK